MHPLLIIKVLAPALKTIGNFQLQWRIQQRKFNLPRSINQKRIQAWIKLLKASTKRKYSSLVKSTYSKNVQTTQYIQYEKRKAKLSYKGDHLGACLFC